jgi:hypothetical protein
MIFLLPPANYGRLSPEVRRELQRTPLSRLLGRPAGLIFLEILSLLLVAAVSMSAAFYAVADLLMRDTISYARMATLMAGAAFSQWSITRLRRYIYPLP